MPAFIRPTSRGGKLVAWSFLLTASVSCAGRDPSATRRIRDVSWDTVWIREASLEDSVLIGPVGMLLSSSGDRLFIPDPGGDRVEAFSTADGSLEWTLGRKGHGPGEFTDMSGASLSGGDTLAVLDPAARRLSLISADGSFLGGQPLPAELYGYSACSLSGGRMLIAALETMENSVYLIDHSSVREKFQLPWPAIAKLPGIVTEVYLQRLNDSTCVGALMRAHGFALLGAHGFGATGKYIEEVDFPEVITEGRRMTISSTTVATRDVSVFEDTIQVLFGGNSPDRGALLDLYDAGSLQYSGSYRLPFKALFVRRSRNTFFALRYRQGLFELLAVRLRVTS